MVGVSDLRSWVGMANWVHMVALAGLNDCRSGQILRIASKLHSCHRGARVKIWWRLMLLMLLLMTHSRLLAKTLVVY